MKQVQEWFEFSKEIFLKFENGNKLFNYENSKLIKNLLKKIDTSKEFSIKNFKEVFENYKQNFFGFLSEEDIKNLLIEKEIDLVDEKDFLSKEEIENLNNKWSLNDFIGKEGIFIGTSKVVLG